jgi:hypothetical protein
VKFLLKVALITVVTLYTLDKLQFEVGSWSRGLACFGFFVVYDLLAKYAYSPTIIIESKTNER